MVYQIDRDGQFTTACVFRGYNGGSCRSLVFGNDGALYGLSSHLFKFTLTGTLTTNYAPSLPGYFFETGFAHEVFNSPKGNLYLTLDNSIWVVNSNADSKELVYFPYELSYLRFPRNLMCTPDQNLYCITDGAFVRVSPTGAYTNLILFNETNAVRSLMQGRDGAFHGMSATHLVKIMTNGIVSSVPLNMPYGSEAWFSPLVEGDDDRFYSTAPNGVVVISPSGFVTLLASFDSSSGYASTGIVKGSDGYFYGVTRGGSLHDRGAFFRFSMLFAPGDVKAISLNPRQAEVRWRNSSTKSDSLMVLRSLRSGGPYDVLTNLSSSVSNFVDVTVEPGLTYYYVVKATNNAGESASSLEAKVKMPIDVGYNLLWQHADGRMVCWVMNGTNFSHYATLPTGQPQSSGWSVTATGDLNGDAYSDLIWRNSDGRLMTWLLHGTNLLKEVSLCTGPSDSTGWQLVSSQDFTGDGRQDFLWANTNGSTMVWIMNRTNCVRAISLRAGSPFVSGWSVIGATDFNKDRKADVLWQNTNGWSSVWLMDGTNFLSNVAMLSGPISSTSWHVGALPDLNHDSNSDFLWQNADGRLYGRLMNGTNFVKYVSLRSGPAMSSGWRLVSPK